MLALTKWNGATVGFGGFRMNIRTKDKLDNARLRVTTLTVSFSNISFHERTKHKPSRGRLVPSSLFRANFSFMLILITTNCNLFQALHCERLSLQWTRLHKLHLLIAQWLTYFIYKTIYPFIEPIVSYLYPWQRDQIWDLLYTCPFWRESISKYRLRTSCGEQAYSTVACTLKSYVE